MFRFSWLLPEPVSCPVPVVPGFAAAARRRLRACAARLPRAGLGRWAAAALVAAGVSPGELPAAERYARLPITSLKSMTVEELLSQPVVSVSRRPERWGDAPSSVFVLRGDAARFSGASRLPELLRLAPNLFVAQSTASHWGVSARGFMRTNAYSNKLLVLVDGRSVYSPFFSNAFWDATDVFLPDLDRIEVISGPAGANWGSNAVNGVINILSKPAHLTQGGLIYVGAGTFEEATFGVRYGGRLGAKGAFRVYAQGADYSATLNAQGQRDDLDAWKARQAGFRADWGAGTGSDFVLQGDVSRGRYDVRPSPQQRVDQANLMLRWTRAFSPDSELLVRAYHDYAMRDISRVYVATTRTSDVEVQHRWVISPTQELIWGGHYRLIDDHVSETVGFGIDPRALRFGVGGGFAQHELKSSDHRLGLTLGLRMENNRFSDWEYQPNVRLSWHPRQNHTLWTAFSRATRTPSRLETGFYIGTEGNYSTRSTFDFAAETLNAYEVGWRFNPTKAMAIALTAFQHEYDHLRTVELGPPITQANLGGGRSRGVETFVDWDVTSWWRLRFGGFLMDQDTWLEPGSTDAERGAGEVSFPEHQLHLRSTFWLGRTATFWVSLRRVDDVPSLEPAGVGRVPAYTELSARFGWQVRPDLELSVVGRHLLDPSHPEIGSVAGRREIPRSVQFLARWEF